MLRVSSLLLLLPLGVATIFAEDAPLTPYPMERGELYRGDVLVPRSLTEEERAFLERFYAVERGGPASTPPPTGPIECPPEYAPTEGILLSWRPGSSGIQNILIALAVNITTVGNARAFIYVNSTSERENVRSLLTSAGADMSRVEFFVSTTDSIWIRDYGPRYIYEGGVRAIVDHQYNRPRPNDDVQPFHFGAQRGHQVYRLPLIHGGGNYHLDGGGDGFATNLIVNENPGVGATEIVNRWRNYQGLETTLTAAYPAQVDSTQHIDMWMLPVSDKRVIISDWPNDPGSAQDFVADTTAAALQARGYTVFRVPARSVGGVHYTYTNAVICNDLVVLPSYTNTTVAPLNATALAVFQEAFGPGKTIVQLNCQAIVTLSGVIHCIVKHVPANRNGATPTAYMRSLNRGGYVAPGSIQELSWATDDDVAVTAVTLEFSPDNGTTWQLIGSGLPAFGTLSWTVPSAPFLAGMVRVTARDADGRQSSDMNDIAFRNFVPPSGFTVH